MKKNLLSNLAAIIAFISSLSSFAQGTGNQPSGNLIYGADGNIYGVYMKTVTPDNRTATIYKYVPGSSTIDPIYRIEDHTVEIFEVEEDGFIRGIAVQYNSSNEPIRSKVFRLKTDGSEFFLDVNANTLKGYHYYFTSFVTSQYGRWQFALRSPGDNFSIGSIVFGWYTMVPWKTPSDRPTSLLPHHALIDIPYEGLKGEVIGIWATSTAGGAFGKGSIRAYGLWGGELDFMADTVRYKPSVDFTGYGGGGLDGEGPVSIVNDQEPAIYAVTQRGGANNEGALFHISGDGNLKLHDFDAPYGQPFGQPFVDSEGKLIGLGGSVQNNSNFIYSYNRQTDTYNNVASFNASTAVNGVTSLVANNGVIYGTSSHTGSDADNGSLFAINQDGTNTQVIFKFVDGYTRLTEPVDGQTEVSVTPSLKMFNQLDGATNYQIEISESSDFSGTVHVVNTPDGLGKVNPPGLKYSTKYYARVKTNLVDDYGTVTTFTTHAPEKYSFVSSPVNGVTNVPFNGLKATANIVYGATLYTIELNTSADFTGTSIVKTSAIANQRTLTFDGLQPSTTYYSRTKTNFPSDWGPTRSFTTAAAAPPPAFAAETNELKVYPNPFEHNFTIAPDESQELSVTLIDLTGRELVKTQEIQQPTTLGDQLVPGIYLLRINENGRTTVKRMVKK
jgi:hypothetical protein